MKIGIFGGSFNPPHAGHLNVATSVVKKMGLDKVFVIPSYQNPLKSDDSIEGAEPAHRLAMAQLAFGSMGAQYEVLETEIDRGGASYTIDTLKALQNQYPEDRLFLIIGVDNLSSFDRWKSWEAILGLADLIVTTRPGWDIPSEVEALPEPIQPLVRNFEFNLAELSTGRTIHFLTLKDVAISSTEIRRSLQIGKAVASHLTLEVENYIKQNKVYPLLNERVDDYGRLTQECVDWMFDRKALNIRAFDLKGLDAIGDYALVASGTSTKHVTSIADYIKQEVKRKYNILPQATEGMLDGKWVVLDYGVLLVHVFYEYVRQAYALEQLWTGAREIGIQLPKPAVSVAEKT